MINEEFEMMSVPRLKSITCDVCKKEYDAQKDIDEIEEIIVINEVGGYGSVFGDGTSIKLDICQHCLKSILGKFLKLN